jgi:hypothetical protein
VIVKQSKTKREKKNYSEIKEITGKKNKRLKEITKNKNKGI